MAEISALGSDRGQAEVVVGFGGYVDAPACLAARKRRFLLTVHEENEMQLRMPPPTP